MAMSFPIFTLLSILLISTVSGACYNKCRFELCYSSVLYLGASDTDITGPVCLKKSGAKIGVMNTGEARVRKYHGFLQKISDYNPYGLKQRFSPSFFKSYSYKYYTGYKKYTYLGAIGHEVPQQNQLKYIADKCIVLPIKHYQVLDKKYNVVDNVGSGKPLINCVAFTTKLYYH